MPAGPMVGPDLEGGRALTQCSGAKLVSDQVLSVLSVLSVFVFRGSSHSGVSASRSAIQMRRCAREPPAIRTGGSPRPEPANDIQARLGICKAHEIGRAHV